MMAEPGSISIFDPLLDEASVVSSDFREFGQLPQEEEHADNRCK